MSTTMVPLQPGRWYNVKCPVCEGTVLFAHDNRNNSSSRIVKCANYVSSERLSSIPFYRSSNMQHPSGASGPSASSSLGGPMNVPCPAFVDLVDPLRFGATPDTLTAAANQEGMMAVVFLVPSSLVTEAVDVPAEVQLAHAMALGRQEQAERDERELRNLFLERNDDVMMDDGIDDGEEAESEEGLSLVAGNRQQQQGRGDEKDDKNRRRGFMASFLWTVSSRWNACRRRMWRQRRRLPFVLARLATATTTAAGNSNNSAGVFASDDKARRRNAARRMPAVFESKKLYRKLAYVRPLLSFWEGLVEEALLLPLMVANYNRHNSKCHRRAGGDSDEDNEPMLDDGDLEVDHPDGAVVSVLTGDEEGSSAAVMSKKKEGGKSIRVRRDAPAAVRTSRVWSPPFCCFSGSGRPQQQLWWVHRIDGNVRVLATTSIVAAGDVVENDGAELPNSQPSRNRNDDSAAAGGGGVVFGRLFAVLPPTSTIVALPLLVESLTIFALRCFIYYNYPGWVSHSATDGMNARVSSAAPSPFVVQLVAWCLWALLPLLAVSWATALVTTWVDPGYLFPLQLPTRKKKQEEPQPHENGSVDVEGRESSGCSAAVEKQQQPEKRSVWVFSSAASAGGGAGEPPHVDNSNGQHDHAAAGGVEIELRWCEECGHYRPPRAVHCHVCGLCVLEHDHHCTVTGACIGKGNLKYFWAYVASTQMMAACATVLLLNHLFGWSSSKSEGDTGLPGSGVVACLLLVYVPASCMGLTMLHTSIAANCLQGLTSHERKWRVAWSREKKRQKLLRSRAERYGGAAALDSNTAASLVKPNHDDGMNMVNVVTTAAADGGGGECDESSTGEVEEVPYFAPGTTTTTESRARSKRSRPHHENPFDQGLLGNIRRFFTANVPSSLRILASNPSCPGRGSNNNRGRLGAELTSISIREHDWRYYGAAVDGGGVGAESLDLVSVQQGAQ